MSRSQKIPTHRFPAEGRAGYFELAPRETAPTIALLRPKPPYVDPTDLLEIGRLRWSEDRARVEFRGNDLPLDAFDVAVIARALDECRTRRLFDRFRAPPWKVHQ